MTHICDKKESIDEILKKIAGQKILQEETFAIASNTSQELEQHRRNQRTHEEKLSVFMTNTNRIMDIVDNQLIPAYQREEKAAIAKEWIKEQAKSGKFWVSVLISIVSFLGILGWLARQSIK